MQLSEDPYETLGVERTATSEEIRSAYRKKTLTMHPDHGGGKEAWDALKAAFDILSNAKSRDRYDRLGTVGGGEMDMHDRILHGVNMVINTVLEDEDDEDRTPVIAKILSSLGNARKPLRDELHRARKKLKRVQTIIKRLKRKRGATGPDLLRNILERKAELGQNRIKASEEAIEIHEGMLKFFADYEYSLDMFGAGTERLGYHAKGKDEDR